MNTQLHKYAERLNQADRLIRQESTGSPRDFARKLNISESHLYLFLDELKIMGLPIVYSKTRSTYRYKQPSRIHIDIVIEIDAI